MRAEIISIGDELTSGERLDTNTQWLSQRLNELGVPVAFHTTVGDDLETNLTAFRVAIDRSDIVVTTGGLGPTADDLTRDALAAATGVDLVQDDAALEHIRKLFARRSRAMPEHNKRQAQFPRGSRVVPNPHGTAPGIDLTVVRPSHGPSSRWGGEKSSCRVFALPGVPAEMKEMWHATIAPAICAMVGQPRVICHRRVKVFGMGESDIESMLPDMIRRKREPLVGITVSAATITLRVTASGVSDTACQQAMAPTIAQIREILGLMVFGEEDDELEHAVVRLLRDRGQSVAVAEWATGGLVSEWLAEAANGSEHFRGGLVVQDGKLLSTALGIDVRLDESSGETTAEAIAKAVREKCSADYGLGIAAFPAVGEAAGMEQPGTLYIGLATADQVRVKGFPVASHPSITQKLAAKRALNVLRLALLNAAP